MCGLCHSPSTNLSSFMFASLNTELMFCSQWSSVENNRQLHYSAVEFCRLKPEFCEVTSLILCFFVSLIRSVKFLGFLRKEDKKLLECDTSASKRCKIKSNKVTVVWQNASFSVCPSLTGHCGMQNIFICRLFEFWWFQTQFNAVCEQLYLSCLLVMNQSGTR